MAASTQTVEKFCSLLAKSKLLTPDEVKSLYRRWQESTGGSSDDDSEPFRKFVVGQRVLTEYQSLLLLRGHADGFFLDQYRIIDLIGKGRMAGVYKAIHSLGKTVAIKVLPPSKAKDPNTLGRFLRESRLLTQLDHPNVVQAFQSGESNGKYFLVMEYLEGETLEEVLERRKRLTPQEAIRLAYQTLLGLQHVNEKGMIHRDLKPANLMLIPTTIAPIDTTLYCTVKILDIGLGRSVFDENMKEPEEASDLTSEGALLGTPDYLAPEQARDARAADIRSDIYSVGCILYHMLTGQPPFPDTNLLTQLVRHATEPPRPLSDFLQPVPEGLQQVLNWMMAKDPNQRYPNPGRAAQALLAFLQNQLDPMGATVAQPLYAPPPQPYVQPMAGASPTHSQPQAGFAPVPYSIPGPTVPAAAASHLPPAVAASMVHPPAAPLPSAASSVPVGKLESSSRKGEKSKEKTESKNGRDESSIPSRHAGKVSEEYDVEVVPVPASTPISPPKLADERSLFEIDRRDMIMAGAGGGIVLAAILSGYGLSLLFRRKPVPIDEPESPKDKLPPSPQTQPEQPPPEEPMKKDE